MGERWWASKKLLLYLPQEEIRLGRTKGQDAPKIKRVGEAVDLQALGERLVKKRMGFVRYYLLPWRRCSVRNRVAAVEEQLEVDVGEKYNDGNVQP
jgi:hypothetical protein